MYDSDFKFLKNRFFFHIAFFFPATPDLPELGQIRTGQPVNSFYYLPRPYTIDICTVLKRHKKRKIKNKHNMLFGTSPKHIG